MPSDIRSFFGGKPTATPPAKEEKKAPAKKGRARKVVDDSDDEAEFVIQSLSRVNHMLIIS
jgi:replication factor C subunit 1